MYEMTGREYGAIQPFSRMEISRLPPVVLDYWNGNCLDLFTAYTETSFMRMASLFFFWKGAVGAYLLGFCCVGFLGGVRGLRPAARRLVLGAC